MKSAPPLKFISRLYPLSRQREFVQMFGDPPRRDRGPGDDARIKKAAGMTTLRIVDDVIELDGVAIAKLLPSVRLSIRDELVWIFDAVDEDADYIEFLERRIDALETKLVATARSDVSN